MPELSRRDFLKLTTNTLLTASGLLGLGALFRFFGYQTEPPPQTAFDLGEASSYPIDSRTLLPNVPALLLHTDQGFSALSLVCTHLGCTVESKGKGFACPCHGSKYDIQGNVLTGPAKKQLNALRVEITPDGNLILHTD
jgi:cytochrome b6-f complex iron-sulfur subunit